jgi:exopolysaccharide biosynthesis protein
MRNDNRYPTRQRYDQKNASGNPPGRRRFPVAWAIVVDFAVAAVLFGIFYYTNEAVPDVTGVSLSPSPAVSSSAPSATPKPNTPKPSKSAASTQTSATDQPTVEPTATAEPLPGALRANFPDKFTTGAVEKTDTSYKSANINITIDKRTQDGTIYYVADIYVADLKYFKSSFGTTNKLGRRDFVDDTIQAAGGILGINGDHCLENKGLLIRNGMFYKAYNTASDVLVLYNDGTMKTIPNREFNSSDVKAQSPYMVWSFGPMLLDNGQPMTKFNSTNNIGGKNNRTAIGYYGPGHYCFVVAEGRKVDNSPGLTFTELSSLMASLGCQSAYNLDGGGTSMMAFQGNKVSNPVSDYRKTYDTIYIADN